MTQDQILSALDNYKSGYYCHFIDLGHPYSYLIDCRLNVFLGGKNWAIAVERLGYNPRAGRIVLQIFYFGNCLTNLEHYNGQDTNYYAVYPVDDDSFYEATDGETLAAGGKFWRVRGHEVELSHNREDYAAAGIDLKEYEPGEIRVVEAARLVITTHRDHFRATNAELYKSLPGNLFKILVLDEWYHRDFTEIDQPEISDDQLRASYELMKQFSEGQSVMDFDSLLQLNQTQQQANKSYNQAQWQDNRPSAYETWKLLASVIATGDPSVYQPTLAPNTHWKFWPDSGSL
jgi:hypothetical protein